MESKELVALDRANEINDVAEYNAGKYILQTVRGLEQMGCGAPGSRLGLSALPGDFTDDEVLAVWTRIREIGKALSQPREQKITEAANELGARQQGASRLATSESRAQ